MTLVDSSVWIDYFRGAINEPTDKLDAILGRQQVLIGDLILTETLQGFRENALFQRAHKLLASLDVIALGGVDVAIEAARNFRTLRRLGVTVRKTIDTIIATRCITDGLTLLHNDRDFDPFVQYLGLRVVTL